MASFQDPLRTSDNSLYISPHNHQEYGEATVEKSEASEIELVSVAKQKASPSASVAKPGITSASEEIKAGQTSFSQKISGLVGFVRGAFTRTPKFIPTVDTQSMDALKSSGGTVLDHPAIKAFLSDPGPKILLIPEGHGSGATMEARTFIAQQEETIKGFSEGESGALQLGGLPGLETPKDFEIAPTLRQFMQFRGQAEMPGMPTTPDELIEILRNDYQVPESDIKHIVKNFINAKDDNARGQQITYFQNERRDINLANKIREQCQELAHDPTRSIGVGFFGATHMMPDFDTEGDVRTTDQRLPQILGKMGKTSEHSTNVDGVNIYYYPEALANDELDANFKEIFNR